MHYSLKKVTLYLLLLCPIYSQVSSGGDLKSILQGLSDEIPVEVLPEVNQEALLLEDEIEMAKDVPYRFGTPIDVQYNLDNSGIWEEITNGRIWRFSIKSENAYSINLFSLKALNCLSMTKKWKQYLALSPIKIINLMKLFPLHPPKVMLPFWNITSLMVLSFQAKFKLTV